MAAMGKWGLWHTPSAGIGPAFEVHFDLVVLRKRRWARYVGKRIEGMLLYTSRRSGSPVLELFRNRLRGTNQALIVGKRRGHVLILEDGRLAVVQKLIEEELWTAF